MDNQAAAPCCGSCSLWQYHHEWCSKNNKYVEAHYLYCQGNYYIPRNPIPIIDIPGVKELVEGVYKEGFKVGYETGDHDKAYPESANAYRTIKFYKYMKALEDKDG